MTELVRRLRDGIDFGDPNLRAAEELMDEAADEIERLRAILTKAYQFISPLSDPMPITAAEMAREIMTELDIHKHGSE